VGKKRNACEILVGDPDIENHFRKLGVDGKRILK
jgi:hypothetical protein